MRNWIASLSRLLFLVMGMVFTFFVLSGCGEVIQRPTSAASNVSVLPYPFLIPELDRQRTVRLYLPPNYEHETQSYPVIYMHDGQNLFDNATAYAEEWGVDESLNALAKTSGRKFIVVAIDNGGDFRMNELSPWANKRFGEAQGKAYMQLIVDVVKPYIDNNYRTKVDVKNTAMMGSSMGGLITHYAIHNYPDVFGKAAIFSPSYWYSQDVFSDTRLHRSKDSARLYVLYGSNEGDGMIADTDKMQRLIKEQGHPRENMQFVSIAGGQHNEQLWGDSFTDAIEWLFEIH
ncbi:putative esterase [Paraglaciecola sp. T6c]|uniref:alpha/beta hydrolase n=1 Tax=Pseudoalteromonas atlantica (strain T6c / ATCC BAA-1087) TaxID=3042615 RepID=UPI00005C759C|nr:alpha/beta hydrolase-fold protein [Paraglaciecola sp. T6c]ABG40856.1 putative esterase [Paraglaciecola sp. T6c]